GRGRPGAGGGAGGGRTGGAGGDDEADGGGDGEDLFRSGGAPARRVEPRARRHVCHAGCSPNAGRGPEKPSCGPNPQNPRPPYGMDGRVPLTRSVMPCVRLDSIASAWLLVRWPALTAASSFVFDSATTPPT